MDDKEVLNICDNILDTACKENQYRDSEIQQGVKGEKQHAEIVLDWVNKLKHNASISLKVAALFHDVDRLVTPGVGDGFKGERKSKEYLDYKKAHAKRSADYICPKLLMNGVSNDIVNRVRFLIEHHDDVLSEIGVFSDIDLDVLVAADVFAWFSSTGIKLVEKEGEERAFEKLKFMLSKIPANMKCKLSLLKIKNPKLKKLYEKVGTN